MSSLFRLPRLRKPRSYCCGKMPPQPHKPGVEDRQGKVAGWDQKRWSAFEGVLIGAGGIGSVVGYQLVRMGPARLHIIDGDTVEASNLNRQFFKRRDLGKPKGPSLAANLSDWGFLGTELRGYPLYLEEFLEGYPEVIPEVSVIGVDNDAARLEAALWALETDRPLVCVGMSEDAGGGYVFVQEPGEACLGCVRGSLLADAQTSPCPGTPAVVDALHVVGGLAAYAVTTLVMPERVRAWNLVKAFTATGETKPSRVQRRADCGVCSASLGGGSSHG